MGSTKKNKKDKIKKAIEKICKKNADFMDDDNITCAEVIEKIGQMQIQKFKAK